MALVRFGNLARDTRIRNGHSLKKVADGLGKSIVYISDIERGRRNAPPPTTARTWAGLIGGDPPVFEVVALMERQSVELSGDREREDAPRNMAALALARSWDRISTDKLNAIVQLLEKEDNMTLAMLVDGTDLNLWANRRDCQAELPRLVRRLIHATVERVERIALPADEGVQLGGWDGIVEVAEGNAYAPDGLSVWELGADRGVKGKADSDYEKRTKDPLGLDPKETTYIFVTPRRWRDKDKWVASKRKEAIWRDVRAYHADDLAAWLESAPGVHVWLSVLLGKHPEEAVDLGRFWEEWSLVTHPPMSAALVITGRHEARQAIHQWLQGAPSALSLRAESREGALAFFAAALYQLPPEQRVPYLSRSVVVESAAAWRRLAASESSLVLIPAFDDRGVVAAAVSKGHHVLVPLGSGDASSGNTAELPRPHRDDVKRALVDMGIAAEEIEDLATLGRRSLAALRRKLATDPAILSPRWAQPAEARALLPALLVGRWDDTNAADREVLSRLVGKDYAALSDTLVRWANESDPPVRRVGDTWMLVSQEDAWPLLARFLTRDDLQRFEAVTLEVLGQVDPRYALPAAERRYAGILGKVPADSGHLREGLAETLGMMATHSGRVQFTDATPGQVWADRIARQLFARATDWPLWASLAWLLPRLAEACPEVFLDAVDRGLADQQPALANLFTDRGDDFDGLFDSSPHTGLLWALELLAWSPDYLGQAALLLATLARLDPGGRYRNRPINSLHEIFLCWHPNTSAQLDQRLGVLDRIREREPEVAWRLLLGLLPAHNEISTPTSTPRWRWRDWAASRSSAITTDEYYRAVSEVARRLLEDVGTDGHRWHDLIGRIDDVPRAEFGAAVQRLNTVDVQAFSPADRKAVWDSLRAVISRHTEFPDAQWAMPGEQIDMLKQAHARFEPADPIVGHAWLFSDRPDIMAPGGEDWREREAALQAARSEAVRALHAEGGVPLLLDFATRVAHPWDVGFAVGRSGILAGQEDDFLSQVLGATSEPHRALALGYVYGRASTEGQPWLEAKRSSDLITRGTPQQRADFYRCLPFEERVWDQIEAMDEDTQRLYWTQVVLWGRGELSDVDHERAVANLVKHGRLDAALDFISLYTRENKARVPAPVITDALRRAIDPTNSGAINWSALTRGVATLLDILDAWDGMDVSQLARFEWFFLPLLEHHRRPPRALHRALATDPGFFHDVLQLVYRAEGDEPTDISEEQRVHARLGNDLLRSWRQPPGMQTDGSINAEELRAWVTAARDSAHASGRGAIADLQIGQVLARVPRGADDAWPHEAVRDLVEDLRSEEIERGLIMGVFNNQGVVTRAIGADGTQERALADTYRKYARRVRDRWPRTTRVLSQIAADFEAFARKVDTTGELEQDTWR